MRRTPYLTLIGLSVSVALVAGCTRGGPGGGGGESGALERFESDSALVEYLEDLPQQQRGGEGDMGLADAAPTAEAPAARTNESITNTQETGVDEGDIVKNVGDYLLVLRKGRLYAVSVAESGTPKETGSTRVAASEELNDGVWYDELLVDDDRIYVVGYRYDVTLAGEEVAATGGEEFDEDWAGATEVNTFRLRDGAFERLGTTFIESWDYFSSDNYASRLVDGRLVFYMPFSAMRSDGDGEPAIPRVLQARGDGKFEAAGPLFAATDVFRPIEQPEWPVFHSIVSCDLPDDGSINCQTRALLGEGGREFYVSPTSVFVWTDEHVYGLDLSNQDVKAHAVSGNPSDQFAFKQIDDTLHVVTTNDAGTEINLLSLPLGAFDKDGRQSVEAVTHELRSASDSDEWMSITAERFVGNTFVAAIDGVTPDRSTPDVACISEDAPAAGCVLPEGSETGEEVLVHDLGTGETARTPVEVLVTRVEALGNDRALLSGSGTGVVPSLELRVVDVTAGGETIGVASLSGSAEGETRSHGFFFRPDEAGGGVFGLPVVGEGTTSPTDESDWWGDGISNIAFFDVAAAGDLATLGAVSARGDASVCETSCTDWYGNTRPIFLKDRVFALMGSELVEITVEPEVARVGTGVTLGAGQQS